MLEGRWLTWTLTALVVLGGLVPAATAERGQWSLDVETPRPISIDGHAALDVRSTDGERPQAPTGLLARWEHGVEDGEGGKGGVIELSADRLTVEREVSTGERIRPPDGGEIWRQQSHDEETFVFENASLTVRAWKTPGVLLVEPSSEAEVAAQATGSTRLVPIEDRRLAWSGDYGGSSGGDAEFPSYEYTVEGPAVLWERVEETDVEGSFSLFANNVILEVEADDADGAGGHERWTNWTGFRTEETAPGVEEYEMRVTRLSFEGGQTSIRSPAGVDVFGRQLSVETRGDVRASDVDGQLKTQEEGYVLKDGRVWFSGHAVSHVEAVSASRAQDSGSPVEPRLALQTEGDVEVQTDVQPQLEPLSAEADDGWSWLSLLPVAGLVTGGTAIALRRPEVLRPLPERWKREIFERWEDEGLRQETLGNYERAQRFYRRLVRLCPQRPMGWYLLSRAQLEGEGPREAIDTVEQARQRLAAVPVDLIELWVEGKADLGETEAVVSGLDEIGSSEAAVARKLARDLGLEEEIEARGPKWWDDGSRRRRFHGYV